MLIVCPNCATSYLINPESVGPTGRAVRCARCKTTWFASATNKAPDAAKASDVSAFVDSVIAEAEAQSAETNSPGSPARPAESMPAPDHGSAADDFGAETDEPSPALPDIETALPPAEPAPHHTDLVPYQDHALEAVASADAPSLVPPIEQAPVPVVGSAEPESDDVDTFAARRQRLKAKRQQSRRSSRWTAVILVLFAFNVALLGARSEVVRYLPQTASLFSAIGLPVNLRNLKFENVRISKDSQDGVNILIIEGNIVSTSGNATEVPRLRFAARNALGQEVYSWTALPARSILGPGESLEFTSRLVSPPADASDIMVRFFNSQDAAAGTK
jgi:predicted Zn finger-like uncharacterized protein